MTAREHAPASCGRPGAPARGTPVRPRPRPRRGPAPADRPALAPTTPRPAPRPPGSTAPSP